jgi:hypothetical protein
MREERNRQDSLQIKRDSQGWLSLIRTLISLTASVSNDLHIC